MHKRYILLLIIYYLCTYFTPVNAQEIILTGAIVIHNTETQSYRIIYNLNKKNELKGYSISDFEKESETKAYIEGAYNPKTKSLLFEEKYIVSTRLPVPVEEFCLMKVSGILETKGKNSVFTGKFTSFAVSKEVICEPGTIMLLAERTLEKLEAKAKELPVKKIPQENYIKEIDKKKDSISWEIRQVELNSGMSTEIHPKSNEITIDFIDDRFQDGDKISILQNKRVIIGGLEITNKVQTLKFDLKNDTTNTITIIADDEGSVALTTIKAVIRNKNEVVQLSIALDKNKSVQIIFK